MCFAPCPSKSVHRRLNRLDGFVDLVIGCTAAICFTGNGLLLPRDQMRWIAPLYASLGACVGARPEPSTSCTRTCRRQPRPLAIRRRLRRPAARLPLSCTHSRVTRQAAARQVRYKRRPRVQVGSETLAPPSTPVSDTRPPLTSPPGHGSNSGFLPSCIS